MSESTIVMGSPLKRKKNEHFDNANAALLQSPFPVSMTAINSPDAKNYLGALFSPAPPQPIAAPDSKDWTPAIRQKVSLDGFSDFPDTTPKGFSRKLELLSPLLADFNEHNHDVSSSSNNNLHFTANSEALRDRLNKRKEIAVDGSMLSPSIHDESLFNIMQSPFRGGSYRTGIAEMMDVEAEAEADDDHPDTQETVNSAVSGIAMITAAALQVEPLSSQTSGSSPGDNYNYRTNSSYKSRGNNSQQQQQVEDDEEYEEGGGGTSSRRKSRRSSHSSSRNTHNTATTTSSTRKRGGNQQLQQQQQQQMEVEDMEEQYEDVETEEDLVGGRRSYMSPEMKNLNMNNNSNSNGNSLRNSRNSTSNEQINCNCKKSKCLKMYCDCFRMSETCRDTCNCMDCNNTEKYATVRNHARKQILDRNPEAFKPRVKEEAREHLTGCHCRKSACLKKYCECYNGNVTCTSRCRCLDCQNLPREKKGGGGSGGSALTKTASVSNASTRSTPSHANALKKTASYPPALSASSAIATGPGGPVAGYLPHHPSPARTVKLSAFEQSMSGGRHSLPKSMSINGSDHLGDHSLLSHSSLNYSDHSNDSAAALMMYEPLKLDTSAYARNNQMDEDDDYTPKYAPQGSPELGQYSSSKRKKAMAYRDVNQSNETSSSTSSGRPQAAILALSQMSNAFSAPSSPMRQSNGNGGGSALTSPQRLLELATLCELRQSQSEEQSKDESQDD